MGRQARSASGWCTLKPGPSLGRAQWPRQQSDQHSYSQKEKSGQRSLWGVLVAHLLALFPPDLAGKACGSLVIISTTSETEEGGHPSTHTHVHTHKLCPQTTLL